jgi:hypothetical protein
MIDRAVGNVFDGRLAGIEPFTRCLGGAVPLSKEQ